MRREADREVREARYDSYSDIGLREVGRINKKTARYVDTRHCFVTSRWGGHDGWEKARRRRGVLGKVDFKQTLVFPAQTANYSYATNLKRGPANFPASTPAVSCTARTSSIALSKTGVIWPIASVILAGCPLNASWRIRSKSE